MKISVDHKKINQLRIEQRMLVSHFISKTKISPAQAYRIINGQQGQVFERTAFKIAKVLNCNLVEFSKS